MVAYTPSRIRLAAAWFVLGVFFFLILWFGYDSFWPPKLIVFHDKIIQIDRRFITCDPSLQIPVFHPGDIVPLRFRGHKYTDDIPTIVTKMVNDSVVELPHFTVINKIGPFDHVGMSRKIPINSHGGIFFFELTYIYNRNFLRGNEIYTIRTEPFEIKVSETEEWKEYWKQRYRFEKDRKEFEKKRKERLELEKKIPPKPESKEAPIEEKRRWWDILL